MLVKYILMLSCRYFKWPFMLRQLHVHQRSRFSLNSDCQVISEIQNPQRSPGIRKSGGIWCSKSGL